MGPGLLQQEFLALKKQLGCLVLAHNYVDMAIQEVADYVGDALQMARFAAYGTEELVLVASVKIMGEAVKLLNPQKRVIMVDSSAECHLAEPECTHEVLNLVAAHPEAEVVCYVNSALELRAAGTVTCTSANCVQVVQALPPNAEIVFIPDANIGRWVEHCTGRQLILPPEGCYAHQAITVGQVEKVKKLYPDYTMLVHPECSLEVCQLADIVCSTSQMLTHAFEHDKLIIGTETGLVEQLYYKYPHKQIVPLSNALQCKAMRGITLGKALQAMQQNNTVVELNPVWAQKALASLNRMEALLHD